MLNLSSSMFFPCRISIWIYIYKDYFNSIMSGKQERIRAKRAFFPFFLVWSLPLCNSHWIHKKKGDLVYFIVQNLPLSVSLFHNNNPILRFTLGSNLESYQALLQSDSINASSLTHLLRLLASYISLYPTLMKITTM